MASSSKDIGLMERSSILSVDGGIQKQTTLAPLYHYKDAKTPGGKAPDNLEAGEAIEGGALIKGGAADLFSRDYIGLLANYAAVGVLYGGFAKTIYPFLNNYLRMDGFQTVAAIQLVSLPWSFKTFIGIISDSFPICGYRRKPYIIIGWVMCLIMLIIMAILPVDEPYYTFPEDASPDIDEATVPDSRKNLGAPDSGAKYILLMMFAALFYIISDVCCDGIVVELAMREPEKIRGTTQTYIYLTRTIFSMLATALVGFSFNGKQYGGTFNWSLEFNEVMMIFAVPIALVVPMTYFCLKDEKVTKMIPFTGRCKEMWAIVQKRVVWQVMGYSFFSGIFSSFGSASSNIVQQQWARVQPLNESIFGIVGSLVFAMVLYVTKNYGLNWDWRRTIAVTLIVIVILDSTCVFMTVFDVFRNQWFWLGVPILEELPYAINFIISTFIVVEIAEEGYEAATYGLLTTVMNLSTPVASSIYKTVDSYFDAYQEDIARDGPDDRWQVAYTFIIMYVMRLLSLGFLVFLPRQKAEAQELKRSGGSSRLGGALALTIAGLALIYSITTNLMSIFPETSCLRIAGGDGNC